MRRRKKIKRKYLVLIGVILVLLILPILVAQMYIKSDHPVQRRLLKPKVRVETNPYMEKLVEEYEDQLQLLKLFSETPGAAIAIVKDSTIVYMKGFGVREVGEKDSINVNTVFRLASVSKCFASFLTGIL